MAAIISDGPRAWALDVLDRKLGRAFAAGAGMGMLVAVYVIEPGPARFTCAIGALVLLVRSLAVPRHVTVEDLAEVEAIVLDLRADVDHRTDVGFERLDRITDLLRGINDQVR